MIRLKRIDLSKAVECNHPAVRTDGTQYLCLIDGMFHAGTFTEVWFGLSFDNWFGGSLQFDEPGTNASDWEAIWEIKIKEKK